MKNEFRIADIVLSVFLIVLMCIGIVSMCLSDHSGKLTLENYEKYLEISHDSKIENNRIKYTITFKSSARYKLSNVNMTFTFENSGVGLERQQREVSFDEKYEFEIYVDYTPNVNGDLMAWHRMTITVISINGQYIRGKI